MSEATTTSGAATASTARPKPSRWRWLGPLLVLVAVIVGWAGWDAWKHHQFEKERTETPPHVVEDLKLKLLWIPAGTFVMGTEDEADWLKSLKKKYNAVKPEGWGEWKVKEVAANETPATVVTLTKGFYLAETEVTQEQWEAVMGSNPSRFKGPNRPVEDISWDKCFEFCTKLTDRERVAGRIEMNQTFRLPTEAEWEYACRAGSPGVWCFGDDVKRFNEFAWNGSETLDVGKKRANDWLLYDMHGNVWEWCADWCPYPGGLVSDPLGAVTGSTRASRGGSWGFSADYCRSAVRNSKSAHVRYSGLGFRLALGPAP